MAATKSEIGSWFEAGKRENATHMIVVCDTFDHEDYPVYAHSDKHATELHEEYRKKRMQRVMEVYDLRRDKAEQLDEARTWNLPVFHE